MLPRGKVDDLCVLLNVWRRTLHEPTEEKLEKQQDGKDRAHIVESRAEGIDHPTPGNDFVCFRVEGFGPSEKGAEHHSGKSCHNCDNSSGSIRGSVEEAEEDYGQKWDEINPVERLKFFEETINIKEDEGCRDDGEHCYNSTADASRHYKLMLAGIGADDFFVNAE